MFKFLLLQFCVVSAQVITGNNKNFNDVVMQSDHVVMVEFFAPWCGHCQKLEPEYKMAAAKLRGIAKLVAVDCDNSANKELCGRYGIQGFPTLKIFSAGKKNSPTDYQGAREASAIINTLKSMIPTTYITNIGGKTKKAVTLDQFKEVDDRLAKVILVTDKAATPVLYKALSLEYLKRLSFAQVKKAETAYVEALGVTDFPSLLLLPVGKSEFIKFDGEINRDNLMEFLDKYALPPKKGTKTEKKTDKKAEKKTEKKEAKKPKKEFDPEVPEITSEKLLSEKCLSGSGICVVTFTTHEPEYPESTAAVNEQKKILSDVKKKFFEKDQDINFVWVNVIEHGQKFIKDFGVSDFYPSVVALTKTHYALSKYAFDETSIFDFCNNFKSGRGKLPYTEVPQLDKPKKEARTEL